MIFYRYHHLISKNVQSPAVSKCKKIDILSVKSISFSVYPEIFIEKKDMVPRYCDLKDFAVTLTAIDFIGIDSNPGIENWPTPR